MVISVFQVKRETWDRKGSLELSVLPGQRGREASKVC